ERLAEVQSRLKNTSAAMEAYRQCMKYDTAFAFRARYQLAQAHLEAGDADEAKAALELNLKLLHMEPDGDREAQEKSLYALGSLLYHRRDYRGVIHWLEKALGRFKDSPESTRARYMLAYAYHQIADPQVPNL